MKNFKKIILVVIILILNCNLLFGKENKFVEKVYLNKIPDTIGTDLKYEGEDLPELFEYVFTKTIRGDVKALPKPNSKTIYSVPFNTKFKVLEKILVKDKKWYKVYFERIVIEKNRTVLKKEIGYIQNAYVIFKEFRFEKMVERIEEVENFISEAKSKKLRLMSTHSYKPNPYNTDMRREKDKYGNSIDQNIVGVHKGTGLELHIPDRSIMTVLKENKKTAEVRVEGIKEYPLTIEKSYLTKYPEIAKGFKKVIVVDIENQNLGAFEKENGQWKLVSYIYGKTGIESELGFETPRGSFIVPSLKYEMGYRDNYGRDGGIAKYAIRFSGGGYLHGTPIEHLEDENREFFLNQKEVGLGTFKGTRKCIRNTESHAKFLFDWIVPEKDRIPSSNYQKPKDNVVFIIF